MTVTIEVLPLSDDRAISFSDLELFHAGCTSETMQKYRNPVTNLYSLRCECGLNIELIEAGTAENLIICTAIDNQCGILPTGSFSSNTADKILIEPHVKH